MRLTRFSVRGFQSYKTLQTLRLEDDVTLLAGRNNVGKSALLRAIRLPTSPEAGAAPDLLLRYSWTVEPDDVKRLKPEDFSYRAEIGGCP